MSLKLLPNLLLPMQLAKASLNRVKPATTMRTHTTNAHISVDPTGKRVVDLTFVEEPLGLPASEGYGWPYLDFGEERGPDGRYAICRKLGWGQTSSTWLARDQRNREFVAIKILTGACTPLSITGERFESQAHKLMSRHIAPYAEHCLVSKAQFTMFGRGSAGPHHSFVTEICGQNLMDLQDKMPYGRFSVWDTKHILLHVLRGVSHAHQSGVIHTDIKPDNILVSAETYTTDEIDAMLVADPPRRHPVEASMDGDVEVAVSQPLIFPIENNIQSHKFVLADFGSSTDRPHQYHEPMLITAPVYRPPEIILGQQWNEKVDIWSFGCLAFELIIGPALFQWVKQEQFNLEPIESVLQQMMVYMGERFDPNRLQKTQAYYEYFNDDGILLKNPPPRDWSLERSIRCYPFVSEEDIFPTVNLIKRCLRLHPSDRPSADELLTDPWFSGVE